MSFIHNRTIYDIARGCDASPVADAASGSFGPMTVGVAAGVPTLFLVVSLVVHLVRLSESARRLIDSVNQFVDRLRACFRWRTNAPEEPAPAASCPPTVSVPSIPMRNLSDSQMAAMRTAPSEAVWM